MIPLPIIYVSDMDRSVRFYTLLGLAERVRSRSDHWVELAGAGGQVALHHGAAPAKPGPPEAPDAAVPAGQITLAFVSPRPLEELVQRLAAAGIAARRGVADEAFGRSVVVADPDGLLIQVNEHDEDLYT